MAATRLIPLHVNKGRSVAACLSARTDYATNPEKTEKGYLIVQENIASLYDAEKKENEADRKRQQEQEH